MQIIVEALLHLQMNEPLCSSYFLPIQGVSKKSLQLENSR